MTAVEELFQITSKQGFSIISKRAPHGRWRISIWLPDAASFTGSKVKTGNCDMSICEVDADTPEQAATEALTRLKKRLTEFGDRLHTEEKETI